MAGHRPGVFLLTQTMIAIDPAALDRIEAKLDALSRKLDAVQIAATPDWMPVSEYARLKGVSRQTVNRRIDSGQLKARGHGKLREVRVT